MSQLKNSAVLFFETTSSAIKKECICQLAYHYFLLKRKILFIVEDEAAGRYLDTLLWSFPANSFLPHTFNQLPNKEKVVIAVQDQQYWLDADVIWNLSQQILNVREQSTILVELFDKTSSERQKCSEEKLEKYQQHLSDVLLYPWKKDWTAKELIPYLREEGQAG